MAKHSMSPSGAGGDITLIVLIPLVIVCFVLSFLTIIYEYKANETIPMVSDSIGCKAYLPEKAHPDVIFRRIEWICDDGILPDGCVLKKSHRKYIPMRGNYIVHKMVCNDHR